MRTHALLTLSFALVAGAACTTTTPIGSEEMAGATGSPPSGAAGATGAAGTTGAAGLGMPGNYVPSPAFALNEQPFTNPSGISGDWVGYFENYQVGIAPGSDAVRFHFGVDAQGHGTLTVKLGNGTVPPPPTSADAAWPVPWILPEGGPGPGIAYPGTPLDGFTYTAREVTWQGQRLKFHLSSSEPWTTWCGLQTSYPLPGSDQYSCNGGNSARCDLTTCQFLDGTHGTTSPNHLYMCNVTTQLCDCNSTGCGAQTGGGAFDVTFYADHAIGSFNTHNVQLMPAAP